MFCIAAIWNKIQYFEVSIKFTFYFQRYSSYPITPQITHIIFVPFGNSQVQMQYNALKIITLKQKKFHVLNSYQNFNCKTNKSKSANLYHTGLKRTLLRIESQDKDNNSTIAKSIQKNPICPRIPSLSRANK